MLIKRLPAVLYYVGLSIYLALERSLQEPDVPKLLYPGLYFGKTKIMKYESGFASSKKSPNHFSKSKYEAILSKS